MPSTNGSKIGLNSHNKPTNTANAALQNTMLRSICIALPSSGYSKQSVTGAERVHVADPLREIEAYRKQGQDRDQRHGEVRRDDGIERESMLAEHQRGKKDLRHGVEFG